MNNDAFRTFLQQRAQTSAQAPSSTRLAALPPGATRGKLITGSRTKGSDRGGRGHRTKDGATSAASSAAAASDTGAGAYRDRAAERRRVGDEVDPVAAAAATLDVESSKLLGGDLAHTHLVRGLDFQLLARLREEDVVDDRAAAPQADLAKGALSATSDENLYARVVRESGVAAAALRFSAVLHLSQPSSSSNLAEVNDDIAAATAAALPTSVRGIAIGRQAYEVRLDWPGCEADAGEEPEPLLVMRSSGGGGSNVVDEGSSLLPRLSVSLNDLITAAFTLRAAAVPAEKVAQPIATAPPLSKPALVLPAAVLQASAEVNDDEDDDNEDIFGGVGMYTKPRTAEEVASDAAAARRALAAAEAAGAAAAAAAASAAVLQKKSSLSVEHTPLTADAVSGSKESASGGARLAAPDFAGYDDDTIVGALSRHTEYSRELVEDEEEAALLARQAASRPAVSTATLPLSVSAESRSSALAAAKASGRQGFAGIDVALAAGTKRPRPDTATLLQPSTTTSLRPAAAAAAAAGPATSKYAALGGDAGPAAASLRPAGVGAVGARTAGAATNFDRRDRDDDDAESARERQRRKQKEANEYATVERLVAEKRAAASKS